MNTLRDAFIMGGYDYVYLFLLIGGFACDYFFGRKARR